MCLDRFSFSARVGVTDLNASFLSDQFITTFIFRILLDHILNKLLDMNYNMTDCLYTAYLQSLLKMKCDVDLEAVSLYTIFSHCMNDI